MEKYINNNEEIKNVTDEEINNIEKRFNMKFPIGLREFYKRDNGSKIEPYYFDNAKNAELHTMYPLKYGFCCEKVKEISEDWLKKELFPLGSDRGGNDIYWSIIDFKCYFIDTEFGDNIENPILVENNVEDLIAKIKIKE